MNLIVAVDKNWGIGYEGTQPVTVPEDRKYFQKITSGGTVIVGRRTLEDFPGGRPLKNRHNIVLSKKDGLEIEGAEVAKSISEVFEKIKDMDSEKVFVIGGDSVYRQFLKYCRLAYVTRIDAEPKADSFFENLDANESWSLETKGATRCHEGIEYSFDIYKNENAEEY